MPSNFSFVAYTTQAHAYKLAAYRTGYAFAKAGFAHAGWAMQAQNRSLHVSLQLKHSQVFQNAFLYIL